MRRVGVIALAVGAAALGGCGDDDEPTAPPAPESDIAVAIAGPVGDDPLGATDRPTRFVLRQVYEPLVSVVDPPFARAGRRKGLALGLRRTSGGTVWVVRLRHDVRFADGDPLNARAVALNARRWAASEPPVIDELVTADAPRADRVRLILSEPVDDLDERLADPRLGIVSPRAIRARPGGTLRFHPAAASGTGPFVIERRSEAGVALTRSASWWGMAERLGPELRRMSFVVEPDRDERLALLATGQVSMADELGGEVARQALLDDPLLTEVVADGSALGVERSVRGLDAAAPGTPLSGVWLTSVNQTPMG